jgi:predicted phosphodiesterase
MRVFALSDIHVDFLDNMTRIETLASTAYPDDALILAGDVSHDLRLLQRALELLRDAFRYVFFVPGNHELWIRDDDHDNSVEKFDSVSEMCARLGIHTQPRSIGSGGDRIRIVPLFSWYTRPEQGADSLFLPKAGEDPSLPMWADNHFIQWPDLNGATPAELFARLNSDRIVKSPDEPTLSFSHFLPRADLMFRLSQSSTRIPENTLERRFNFSRVAGSSLIERQIRDLGSILHVYGHQHRNRCRNYDGVWYVSNCLGYRHERLSGTVAPSSGTLKMIWPLRAGDGSPLLTVADE